MRRLAAAVIAAFVAACSSVPPAADPASDAPDARVAAPGPVKEAASYADTLRLWQSPEDVNAWIAERFQYDMARAMQLSETQRQQNGRLPIVAPADFFAAPSGVCVDLSRFAVETLRSLDPALKPRYLMIEFDPVAIAGNTLRRHWVAAFERDGSHYVFADSKRPGHIAGPYASTQAFVAEYAGYRGRSIVSFRELDSFERKVRTLASRQGREEQRDE